MNISATEEIQQQKIDLVEKWAKEINSFQKKNTNAHQTYYMKKKKHKTSLPVGKFKSRPHEMLLLECLKFKTEKQKLERVWRKGLLPHC